MAPKPLLRYEALRPALATRSFAVGALVAGVPLDLDALGLTYRSGSLNSYLQHPVLVTRPDPILVDFLRQHHTSAEGAAPTLPDMVAAAFRLRIFPTLPADRKNPVMYRYVHVLLLHPGKLGLYDQIPIFLKHVHRRRPLSCLPALLPTRPTPRHPAEHLVEHAVHLTVQVVESPASKRTHRHLPDLLFFATPPKSRPLWYDAIISFTTVFKHNQDMIYLQLLILNR